MADIANVTGTLDDKELNFQHSIGTVYKASASIDGSKGSCSRIDGNGFCRE